MNTPGVGGVADKPLVLLVDDEASERELLTRILARDFRVRTAADVEAALAEVRREAPDLIITDVVMPGAGGMELLKALRHARETRTVPVLLISGRATDESRIEGFEIDADGYLQKPFTDRELLARAWSLLRLARSRAQAGMQAAREQAERDALVERARLLESITDGFYALDEQWRFTYLNQRALDYFQASREQVLGKNIWDVVPVARGSAFETQMGRVMTERKSATFEAFSPHSQQWVELHAYPAKEGIAVHFRDISQRKRAEASLRRAEERLRRAVSVGTVGVLFFRLDGAITDANDAFQRMSGYSREELISHTHWKTLTVESFHAVTEARARDLVEHGHTEPYEKQMRRKDGSVWWGLFAPTRLSGEGADTECVEFIIDITGQRAAQQALEQADRRKDEFLAILAHELRNPLAPLRNGLQIARLTSRPDSPLHRTIDMMDRQLNHLVHLVDDLLDVARISSGKVVLRREPVRLREVLAQAVEASRAGIDAREQQLEVEVSSEELVVEGDADRLAQVFSNLLSNAAKYTPNGGRIRVRLERENAAAVVQVIDTGIGIPREDLQNVFELFSQVREHQRHAEGGLGIGLSLVKSLVAHHGGSVSADSEGSGTGSTFTVRLPLLQPTESRPQPDALKSLHGPAQRRRRILVADDNVDAVESLSALIGLHGHEVQIAHSGREALDIAARFQPDLAFLDLKMPDLDGFETARQLRATREGQRTVLVALTGWGQDADRQRTRAAGFDAHLVKPIDEKTLLRTLELAGRGP